ncbi:MAG: YeiH family protein [Thermoleophilia bacterium]
MHSTIEEAGSVSSRADVRQKSGNFFGRTNAAPRVPGMLLCLAIAAPSLELARYSPSVDALTLSLIMGMIIRNVIGSSEMAQPGIRMVSMIFIPAGILLYGTRLDFQNVADMPLLTTATIMICIILFFTVILLGVKKLGIDQRTGLLIASGTAICGASAIAVLSPVVGARSRDTSMALIVTTTAGLIGALLYPMIADAFSLSDISYGIFCGSTLQQMGIVRLASSHLGDAAVAYAVPVKMLRIAMLAPITLFLAGKTAFRPGAGITASASSLQVLKRNWFLPLFVAVALVFSFFGPAASLRTGVEPFAIVFLALGLASVGLSVDFNTIKSSGSRPLLVGVLGWALVATVILVALVPFLTWKS